jgi:hypothetical protein
MKTMRHILLAAIAGCGLALAASSAMAQVVSCTTITTIRDWAALDGGCDIGDKNWDLNTAGENLLPATISFFFAGTVYAMQITNFDNSDLAGSWTLNYTITVLDPTQHISVMAAGADNPGGGSLLTKDVTGDPGGPFTLTDTNGVEQTGVSNKAGLNASALTVNETFSVDANSVLLSVSDTFVQTPNLKVPEPGSLLLLAAGFGALGLFGRRRDKRA